MDKVNALFSKYLEKYPLHRFEIIIDKMLDDGVITFEDAKNLREGKSVFSVGNNYFTNVSNDMTMSEIMGGHFSTKSSPKTNFNKKIEYTNQPYTQGDCWLLSDINALNTTEWGRKAIEEAIIPDTEGKGGVTIRFKGSPLEQKEIYIAAEEIANARESGNYVAEDDDMIAFELATEKTFREMVRQGLAERVEDDEYLEFLGAKYRSYIFFGVKNEEFSQYPISELLGVEAHHLNKNYYECHPKSNEINKKALEWFGQNKNNATCVCAFGFFTDGWGNKDTKDYIKGGHAYAVKDFIPGKEVIVSDPHYSEHEIKVPWDVFKEWSIDFVFSFKNETIKQDYKKILPKNLDNYIKDYKKLREDIKNKKLSNEEAYKKGKELLMKDEDIKLIIDFYTH